MILNAVLPAGGLTGDLTFCLTLEKTCLSESHLQYELQNAFNLNSNPCHVLASNMHSWQLLLDRPDHLSSFSVFFMGGVPSRIIIYVDTCDGKQGGLGSQKHISTRPILILENEMLAAKQIQDFHVALITVQSNSTVT
jgi:hypothetical protein